MQIKMIKKYLGILERDTAYAMQLHFSNYAASPLEPRSSNEF